MTTKTGARPQRLDKKGTNSLNFQTFNVQNGKLPNKRPRKEFSIMNATKVILENKGYKYVEGTITNKRSKKAITHAWNVDPKGNHIDFTPIDSSKYIYDGVIIPMEKVFDVQRDLMGGVFCPVLPFINN